MAVVFKLPDLGENIESAEVVSVAAAVGDMIEADQTIIEVETDKAVTDVPAPIGGKLLEIAVAVGDKLAVGDIIATIEEAEGGSVPGSRQASGRHRSATAPKQLRRRPEPRRSAGREASAAERRRRTAAGRSAGRVQRSSRSWPPRRCANSPARSASTSAQVAGSGPAGRISIDDVKVTLPTHAGRRRSRPGAQSAARFRQVGRDRTQSRCRTCARRRRCRWKPAGPHRMSRCTTKPTSPAWNSSASNTRRPSKRRAAN